MVVCSTFSCSGPERTRQDSETCKYLTTDQRPLKFKYGKFVLESDYNEKEG